MERVLRFACTLNELPDGGYSVGLIVSGFDDRDGGTAFADWLCATLTNDDVLDISVTTEPNPKTKRPN